MNLNITLALQLAGIAQIILVLASIAIPRCLEWNKGLAGLSNLLRQMYWTYAIYITGIHLFAGIISLTAAEELINGSYISTAVCVLMAVWWGARIIIQFTYFDTSSVPTTPFTKCAEIALVSLFATLTAVYSWAVYINLG